MKRSSHTGPLFKESGLLKLYDKISLENCIFINNSLNSRLPSVFHNWFTLISESHEHNTRLSEVGCLKTPHYNTKTYGRYSVIVNAVYNWNFYQKLYKETLLHTLKKTALKKILLQHFRSKYYWQTLQHSRSNIIDRLFRDISDFFCRFFCTFNEISFWLIFIHQNFLPLRRAVLHVLALLSGNCPLASNQRFFM